MRRVPTLAALLLAVLPLFACAHAHAAVAKAAPATDRKPAIPADTLASPGRAASTPVADTSGAPPGAFGVRPTEIPEDLGYQRRNAIVRAAEAVGSAVVSISTIEQRVVAQSPVLTPWAEQFFAPFQLFPQYQEEVPKLGSGFFVDPRGYLLTNEHVVHGAITIKVTLADGREFDGKLIGSDPNYDLAVLKVEGENFPQAPIGNSDDLLVGEWAIAIGNPFGYLLNDAQPSVTAGVISAKHRDVKSDEAQAGIYKDMVQTDAAINPGNSGGPLVNGFGEVIGINTFIFSQAGGSLGIGFAIPINTALTVADEIIRYGRVRGVWVGISVQEITPYIAARLGLKDRHGLIVWRVEGGSPAARAGIEVGDVLQKINGRDVVDSESARRGIFGLRVGDSISLDLDRKGARRTASFVLEELPRRQSP